MTKSIQTQYQATSSLRKATPPGDNSDASTVSKQFIWNAFDKDQWPVGLKEAIPQKIV